MWTTFLIVICVIAPPLMALIASYVIFKTENTVLVIAGVVAYGLTLALAIGGLADLWAHIEHLADAQAALVIGWIIGTLIGVAAGGGLSELD